MAQRRCGVRRHTSYRARQGIRIHSADHYGSRIGLARPKARPQTACLFGAPYASLQSANPVLLSGTVVPAILDGRKTQTRQAVKGPTLNWLNTSSFTPNFQITSACPRANQVLTAMPVLVRGSSVARAASRFTLEATDVCVERQQDIGEENTISEVIEPDGDGWTYMGGRCVGVDDEVLRVIVGGHQRHTRLWMATQIR
jgi:hypothetical protein